MFKIGIVLVLACVALTLVAKTQRKSYKHQDKMIKDFQKEKDKAEEKEYKKEQKRKMDRDLYDTRLEIKKNSLKSNAECADKLKKAGTEYTTSGGLKRDVAAITKAAVGAELGNFKMAASGAKDLANKERVEAEIVNPDDIKVYKPKEVPKLDSSKISLNKE